MGWVCREAFLTLGSDQFERLVGFYQGLLQQVAQPYWPDRYAEFALPGMKLALFRPQVGQQAEFDQPAQGGLSLCLEVVDLEGAIAHLTTLGYPPPGPVMIASHGREIYAYDPDGNRLILHQSHPPSL
ncbi:glyoxalase [Pseudanabaena sp. FACHB-2040]|nr:glyoxalase [Pseudanabaena sp. FACHB-2040]